MRLAASSGCGSAAGEAGVSDLGPVASSDSGLGRRHLRICLWRVVLVGKAELHLVQVKGVHSGRWRKRARPVGNSVLHLVQVRGCGGLLLLSCGLKIVVLELESLKVLKVFMLV